jgi:hypothetical protein
MHILDIHDLHGSPYACQHPGGQQHEQGAGSGANVRSNQGWGDETSASTCPGPGHRLQWEVSACRGQMGVRGAR